MYVWLLVVAYASAQRSTARWKSGSARSVFRTPSAPAMGRIRSQSSEFMQVFFMQCGFAMVRYVSGR
jgi:hypothetical protein